MFHSLNLPFSDWLGLGTMDIWSGLAQNIRLLEWHVYLGTDAKGKQIKDNLFLMAQTWIIRAIITATERKKTGYWESLWSLSVVIIINFSSSSTKTHTVNKLKRLLRDEFHSKRDLLFPTHPFSSAYPLQGRWGVGGGVGGWSLS